MNEEKITDEMLLELGQKLDKWMEDAEIILTIRIPAGTTEQEVELNTGGNAMIESNILMTAFSNAYLRMYEELPLKEDSKEELLDDIFDMMKREILGAFREGGEA